MREITGFNMTQTINVVDAMCGAGKTSWAIQMINDTEKVGFGNSNQRNTKYIYVTPFLDEVDRIRNATDIDFFEPEAKGTKIKSFEALITLGKSVATTHELKGEIMKIHYFVVIVFSSVLLFCCSSNQKNDNVAKAEVQDTLKEQGIKSNLSSNIISPNQHSIQTPTFTLNEKVNDVIMVYEIRGENRNFGYLDKPLIMDKEIKLEWLFWTME
ncbi:hypothetical protein [Peribacillus frigoritolerans]|uniref:hypothetical protein n=1 Tax=Peribacillus frigoritolerans TaxID=450367 RepID=UPI002415E310|nr:hypothetical protein [Peribacillus frigoritolerans]MDG4850715.1 hypothetical protein [Peribacillus frigoritolerans]